MTELFMMNRNASFLYGADIKKTKGMFMRIVIERTIEGYVGFFLEVHQKLYAFLGYQTPIFERLLIFTLVFIDMNRF